MKKILYTAALLLFVTSYATAQSGPWNGPTSGMVTTDNLVGISTATPTEKLHVVGNIRMGGSARKIIVGTEASVSDYLLLQDAGAGYPALQWVHDGSPKFTIEGSTGNVGIGVALPADKLSVDGDIRMSGASRKIIVGTSGTPSDYLLVQDTGTGGPAVQWVQDGSPKFTIEGSTGNVGIGTDSPTEELEVKGTVYSNEVKVDVNAGTGPDYVFEKSYDLLPLDKLESFVSQNKHLPEVPSANEMEENGLKLKEMNLLLLKKVEELTLYLLEERKAIQELQMKAERQQKEIEDLQKIK